MSVGVSHCEPIVLLGESRRRQLSHSLQQSLQAWRQQWSGGGNAVHTIEPAECLTRRAPLPGGRLLAFGADAGSGPSLIIAVPVDAQYELLGLAAPRAAAESGDIANAVVTEALQALCLRLAESRPTAGINVKTYQGEGLAQLWSRNGCTVAFKTASDRVLMWARLSSELLLTMLPLQLTKAVEPLTPRRSAIGEEAVGVQAWLGEAEVTLHDLAALQVGDVILLDASVDAAGHLALPDGRYLAGIRLGSRLGRRAVSVIGKTTAAAGRSGA